MLPRMLLRNAEDHRVMGMLSTDAVLVQTYIFFCGPLAQLWQMLHQIFSGRTQTDSVSAPFQAGRPLPSQQQKQPAVACSKAKAIQNRCREHDESLIPTAGCPPALISGKLRHEPLQNTYQTTPTFSKPLGPRTLPEFVSRHREKGTHFQFMLRRQHSKKIRTPF